MGWADLELVQVHSEICGFCLAGPDAGPMGEFLVVSAAMALYVLTAADGASFYIAVVLMNFPRFCFTIMAVFQSFVCESFCQAIRDFLWGYAKLFAFI
jgi:hypothetical protein